jgi:SAM-dependent methyltransferase
MTLYQDTIVNQKNCRVCGTALGRKLIAFDALPVAGAYVSPHDPPPDPVFPLSLLQCTVCGLVQLRQSVTPSFYSRYSFMSGVAAGYMSYLGHFAEHISNTLDLGTRVLEIGCSDGSLLDLLRNAGFRVAGFEPAREPALAAQRKQLEVVNQFFNEKSASSSGFERADLIVIRHVLEHIDDFWAIFQGIDQLAKPNATLLVEVPDLTSTIEHALFSNIYHIHSCYFDVRTMSDLLDRHGWQTAGSTTVDIFGGSLLLWAQRKGMTTKGPAFSFREVALQSTRAAIPSELDGFVLKCEDTARCTLEFFDRLRNQGARVAGYGAAERTVSTIGMSGLDASHVSVIFDRNPNLVGRMLPGTRIPILHPDAISELNPEYLVVFAQSFEDEIIRQQSAYRDAGGRFISLKSGIPRVLAG